jgi:hypothetical protein
MHIRASIYEYGTMVINNVNDRLRTVINSAGQFSNGR